MAGLPTIYKRYQGQYTRSISASAMAVIAAAICYFLYTLLYSYVPTDDVVDVNINNLNTEYVFAQDWSDGKVFYKDGDPVTKEAMENLKASKNQGESISVRAADPVDNAAYWQYGIPSAAFIAFAIGIFYLVNNPRFADFLIATESEMKKVSWSSKAELIGSTIVVIVTVLLLSVMIYCCDFLWSFLLTTIHALPKI